MRTNYARKFSFFMRLLYVQLLGEENRYGLVCAVVINPPELPTDDDARNEAHVARTGVRWFQHKKRNGKLVIHHKMS